MIPLFIVAFSIFGSAAASADDAVVAQVGTHEVKLSEVAPYFRDLPASDRESLKKNKEELSRFVRLVLVREAVLRDAAAAGWDKKPEVVAAADHARQQFLAESYLVEVSKVPADYPPEADIKAAYESQKDRMRLPRRYELSQIYIASDAKSADAARKEAAEIASKLKSSPGDFGKIAREKSAERESAARDGKIGWLAEDSVAPEVRKAIAGLSKGQTSAVIEARDGFHIVRVDDLREPGVASYGDVKDELSALLRQQRAALNRDAHVSSLLSRQPISVNEIVLDQLQ